MPTLIDPTQIPGLDLEPDDIDAAARRIRAVGSTFAKQGKEVCTTWQRLAASYEAPEDETLFAVMGPVKGHATTIGSDLEAVSTALVGFAADVRPIKAALATIRHEAYAFRATTRQTFSDRPRPEVLGIPLTGTPPWHEDAGAVAANDALIARVNDQVQLLWAAERRCANTIYDLTGHTHLVAGDDPAATAGNGYGLSSIPSGTPTDWGAEGPKTRTPHEAIDAAAARFVLDPLADAAAHLGFSRTGGDIDWSPRTAVAATTDDITSGIQIGATAFAFSAAGQQAATQDTPFGRRVRLQRAAGIVAARSVVAGIKADPWGSGTTTVLTVGSFFIPVVGEAKAAELAGRSARSTGRILARASDAARLALTESRAGGLSRQALRTGLRTLEMSPSELRASVRQLQESLATPQHALAVNGPQDLTLHMEDGGPAGSGGGAHALRELSQRIDDETPAERRARYDTIEQGTDHPNLAYEPGAELTTNERRAAQEWLDRGYQVKILKEVDLEDHRTPDAEVRGEGRVDFYGPTSNSPSHISKMIRGKGTQTSWVQVDLWDTSMSRDEIDSIPRRTFGYPGRERIDRITIRIDGVLYSDERRRR